MSEQFANRIDTINELMNLGFQPSKGDENVFMLPDGNNYNVPGFEVEIYRCSGGWWCVDIDGGYRAPVVWNGPKAEHDNEKASDRFINFIRDDLMMGRDV